VGEWKAAARRGCVGAETRASWVVGRGDAASGGEASRCEGGGGGGVVILASVRGA